MNIRERIKLALGYVGLLEPVTTLWQMTSPKGRQIQQRKAQYSQYLLDLYRPFIPAGTLCFDIGANHGVYTDNMLKLGARVVAVEPLEECTRLLKAKYFLQKRVQVVAKGVAESEGEREFFVSSNDSVSTMSTDWQEAIKERGGKFAKTQWSTKVVVPVTTLDTLIKEYGKPHFCKIDVEGFEYNVLRGLSQPINGISFEYTSERIQPSFDCIQHLCTLGTYEFNYSIEGQLLSNPDHWVSADQIRDILRSLEHKSGDVYARLVNR